MGKLFMRTQKSGKAKIIAVLLIVLTVLLGGYAVYFLNEEIKLYDRTSIEADAFFQRAAGGYISPQPFVNPAADAEPYSYYDHRDDALYSFDAPEGFSIISHAAAWDTEMLELLYVELMRNEHGDEINMLYEIVVYPDEEEEGSVLATYSLSIKAVSFFTLFPAFPVDFTIDFPQDIGRITLFGGETRTTIESMASSLSHEYGHLYSFYYMFDSELNADGSTGSVSLAGSEYAFLREAARFDLITDRNQEYSFGRHRHRFIIEIAAEDYVQLMGSPTTRQIVDFMDVQQIINGAEHPQSMTGARNAFPQENMKIPLANEVTGLKDYFYSYIDTEPRVPAEERLNVVPEIRQSSVQFDLVSGTRTFVYYTITWNTPYESAVYTLICYDPDDYTGWGIPIKTVHPGQAASAVIGEYVVERGNQVVSLDDGNAQGKKVFIVVALLPDGTLYTSDKLEYEF